MKFRAGDHVRIESIDEDWVLAADEVGGRVVCAGWPESTIEAGRCRLLKAASDQERVDMLNRVAKSCHDGMRGAWAREQLEARP